MIKRLALILILAGTAFGQVLSSGVTLSGGVTISSTAGPPPPPPSINSPVCGNGVVGVAYNCAVSATSGTPPYVFSTVGTLPAGLNPINSSTGVINGTPTTVQTSVAFTVVVTDSTLQTGTQSESVSILAAGCGPPLFPCSSVSSAVFTNPTFPFNASSVAGATGYDTSINPMGTDEMMLLTDISTCGGNGISLVGISGGAESTDTNIDDTLFLVNCVGGTEKAIGFNPATFTRTGVSNGITHLSGGATFAHTNKFILYSQTQIAPAQVWKTTFTSTNPPTFTQAMLIDPSVVCAPFIPSGLTGGTVTVDDTDTYIYGALLTMTQDSPGYIYRYNMTTGKCTAFTTTTTTNNVRLEDGTIGTAVGPNLCLPINMHNSTIFGNGLYGRFTTKTLNTCTNEPYYWQINTVNVWGCGAGTGTGHNANGFNLEVESNNPHLMYGDVTTGQASYCAQVASQSYGNYPYAGFAGGDLETHFDYASDPLDSFPIIAGTGWANWDGTLTFWTLAGINEVLAYHRSGPNFYTRFGHTFNSGGTICPFPQCDFRTINGIIGVSQTERYAFWPTDGRMGLGNNCKSGAVTVQCQFIVLMKLD